MGKSSVTRKRKAKKRGHKRAAQKGDGTMENVDSALGNVPSEESITAAENMEISSGTGLVKTEELRASVSILTPRTGKEDLRNYTGENQNESPSECKFAKDGNHEELPTLLSHGKEDPNEEQASQPPNHSGSFEGNSSVPAPLLAPQSHVPRFSQAQARAFNSLLSHCTSALNNSQSDSLSLKLNCPINDQDVRPKIRYTAEKLLSLRNLALPHVAADLTRFFSEVCQDSKDCGNHRSVESRLGSIDKLEATSLSPYKITISSNPPYSIGMFYKRLSRDSLLHTNILHKGGVARPAPAILPHQNSRFCNGGPHPDGPFRHKEPSRDTKVPGLVIRPKATEKEAAHILIPESIPELQTAPSVSSVNRWVPKSRSKKEAPKLAPDGTILLSEEEVKEKTKSALNKVTLKMLGPISLTLLQICKQSVWEEDARTLKVVLQLVLAKACDEPHWSSVYADLCAKIFQGVSPDIEDMGTLKNGVPESGGQLARRVLLSCCQADFGRKLKKLRCGGEGLQPAELEMLSDEYYVAKSNQRKGLGLMKLIGNLYKLELLHFSIIIQCLRDLLDCTTVSESSLAMLIEFLQIVGPVFDAKASLKLIMNKIFQQLDNLLERNEMVSKSKYTLMNLQEQRVNNWKPKIESAEPKAIKQIHNKPEATGQANGTNYRGNSQSFRDSTSSVSGSRGRGLGTAVWASKPILRLNKF